VPKKRTLTPGISPSHFFGAEVRHAREAAGISQAQLGKLASCDDSAVSRVEAGLTEPPAGFPGACDAAFPAMNGFFARFWAEHEGWTEGMYPQWADAWMKAEDEAVTLRIWQPLIFPGLLQTPDYARALFLGSQPGLSEETLEIEIGKRVARQRIFDRQPPPHLAVILDQSVLHRMIGSPEITYQQLIHTADMSRRSSVTVQVVPSATGAHAGLGGAFMIAGCVGKADTMFIDAVEGQTIKDRPLVTKFAIAFDDIRSEALPASMSRELILREAEERWKTQKG
jgi:hypothetical protein